MCKTCIKFSSERARRRLGMKPRVRIPDSVKRANQLILSRQQTGTHYCLLENAEYHKSVAHYHDELGGVSKTDGSKYAVINALITLDCIEKRFKKTERKEIQNPLVRGRGVKQILFDRVRHRIRKFGKRYGFEPPRHFTARGDLTIDEFFQDRFGYSADDLMLHLARQFTEGMTWLEFASGEIHMDHISPMAMFDIRDPQQIRACFAMGNLQPLWSRMNARKNSRCDLTGHKIAARGKYLGIQTEKCG